MKQWGVFAGCDTDAVGRDSGCGPSGTSLTAQQLQEQNKDEKYVQVGGVSLHYRQDGLGKPLIFLHGLLTSSSCGAISRLGSPLATQSTASI